MTLFIPSYRGFTYDGLATLRADRTHSFFSRDTLFGYDPRHITVMAEHCRVRELDSLGLAPTLIKIDVEGGELDVLKGAAETIRRHHPTLMIERFYEDSDVQRLLASLDYVEVVPSERGFHRGRSTDLNMFWMHDAVVDR